MTSLTFADKKLLENLLGMGSGYVLDFSDVTYAAFFREQRIDIDHQRYHINGTSKAKRMRAFWELATDEEAGKVINALLDYIEATEPKEAGAGVQDKHRSIAHRLLGTKPTSTARTEKDFLKVDFGDLKLHRLSLDPELEKAVKQRIEEIQQCLSAEIAPLAAVFLSGSTLEGSLLNTATKRPADFNQAKAAPKDKNKKPKQLQDWTLNDLINVACEVGAIGLDVKKHSHSLRDFRNYIHPYEQARAKFKPDKHTAKISWQVLQAAIADLVGKRP